jgi:excisionase family DNA binding protein
MNDESLEIMTIEEVAKYLRIPVSTVYRLAQQGRIPANKIGRQWRFYRPMIQQWLAQGEPSAELSILTKADISDHLES